MLQGSALCERPVLSRSGWFDHGLIAGAGVTSDARARASSFALFTWVASEQSSC